MISLAVSIFLGYAATSGASSGIVTWSDSQTRLSLQEAFQPIREDLLLIQPLFPKPLAPALEPWAFEEGDTLEFPAVFRVQVMALSNKATAGKRQAELGASLGVPVSVVRQGELFVVQAGKFAERADAEVLCSRIAKLGPGYVEAFVLAVGSAAAVAEPGIVPPMREEFFEPLPSPGASLQIAKPERLELVDGWRLLLDQFLRHTDAEQLVIRARHRLERDDIYVTFKPPWYKVEVGNYVSEIEAQEAVDRIKRRGFDNALRVRARVNRLSEQY